MYYRIWDLQTERHLCTGYNASSLEELKEAYMSLIGPQLDTSDPDDVYVWDSLELSEGNDIINKIESCDFVVESSFLPFEEHPELEFDYETS